MTDQMKIGDVVTTGNRFIYTLIGVDGDKSWVKNSEGERFVVNTKNLRLMPDTVTIEIPRKIAESWNLEFGLYHSYVPEIGAIIDACREVLGR